jgi:sterol desaturase/sphingolipid hydroxylase (fatty acid hydroxylase superfamily)
MTAYTLATALALSGLFLILFVCERWVPLRHARRAPARRLWVNLSIAALAIGTAAVLVQPAGATALQYVSERRFGLIHWMELPATAQSVFGFLLLDLTFYYWHLANHKFSFLWRFHNVHHIDRDLDVSTAFRFHFGEVALSAGFRVVQIAVIGVSPVTFALYELVFQANTLFHHSNVRLPIAVERFLNRFLVTPRMHGVHHSEVQCENNSNFSVVFPWWDRFHRTLRLNVPQSQIVIGIAGYAAAADNQLTSALMMPFKRQRNYWRRADGTTSADRIQINANTPLSYMQE